MAKKILSLVLCFFVFQLLSGQDVPEVQRPLIGKVAATWCPPCGSWGWDMFENLVDQNEEKATLITAHHSGELVNDLGIAFSENFNAPYQPYFYVYNEDQDVSQSNVTEKLVEIKEKVDAESLLSPIANAGLLLELDGSDLSVTTKTKFFKEATGEFYLGVYFVENEIIAFQASQGNNAVHEKILRGSISNGSFGELLGNGTIETGTEFDHNFSASILDMNVDHLEVITILWKKEGDTYMVINTNISTDFQQTSSTENALEQSITFEVIPNVVHEMSNISISSQNSIKRAKISLVTASGRHIETIYAGSLLAGNSNFSFHKTTSLASGVYYITLESEEGILTRSVMIK